jgi:hypothetical protein
MDRLDEPYLSGMRFSRLSGLLALQMFTLLAVLSACGSSGQPAVEECRFGAPQPIFKADDSTVVSHTFLVDKQSSTEQIGFSDGLELVIQQDGCDALKQRFVFADSDLAGASSDSFLVWAEQRFIDFAGLSPRLLSFGQYAAILAQRPENFLPDQAAILAPGLSLRFSELASTEKPTWRLEMEQEMQ